jgi:type II secretory pathway pseudopilin PulG
MNRKRGFTLVELLIVSSLTTMVVGTLGAVVTTVLTRSSYSITNTSNVLEQHLLFEEIGQTIEQACEVELVTQGGMTALVCTMPKTGVDTTGDNVPDKFEPDTVSRRQIGKYERGLRIWYYRSDATGEFGKSGSVLWRAIMSNSNKPGASDADRSWAYYYEGKPRWGLIESVGFTLDANSESVKVFCSVSTLARNQKRQISALANPKDIYVLRMDRTFYVRNWWK